MVFSLSLRGLNHVTWMRSSDEARCYRQLMLFLNSIFQAIDSLVRMILVLQQNLLSTKHSFITRYIVDIFF